jgi:hypothetical protein
MNLILQKINIGHNINCTEECSKKPQNHFEILSGCRRMAIYQGGASLKLEEDMESQKLFHRMDGT